MPIFRGFSDFTSFNCSKCLNNCCVDDYPVPFLENEIKRLPSRLADLNIRREQIHFKTENVLGQTIFRLVRKNKCVFFDEHTKKCRLHQLAFEYKPLNCILYPIQFWEFKKDHYLVLIEPCSNGFRWYTDSELITNERIMEIIHLVKKRHYRSDGFYGDFSDNFNPYEDVPEALIRWRVDVTQTIMSFFTEKNLPINEIVHKSLEAFHPSGLSSLYPLLSVQFADLWLLSIPEFLGKRIQAVLHWLFFTAAFLYLPVSHAITLGLVCTLFLLRYGQWSLLNFLHNESMAINADEYAENFAWQYVNCLKKGFWKEILVSFPKLKSDPVYRQSVEVMISVLPK